MTDFTYVIKHGPGVAARVLLNDLPFYRERPATHDGTSASCRHWLVPGTNMLTLEVFGEDPAQYPPAQIDASVRRPATDAIDARVNWPEIWAPLQPEQRTFPARGDKFFEIDDELPPPLWDQKRGEDVPLEGNDELIGAVYSIHDAIARGDAHRFVELSMVKIEDLQRYYGSGPTEGEVLDDFSRRFGREKLKMQDFDPKLLRFEARQGGRVVHVTRTDGGRAIRASNAAETQGMTLDPLFVRHGGSWRLYR